MVFSSSLFLLYFLPLFLIIYYVLDRKYKNIFTLIASIFFYAWGAPTFIFIVIGSIVVDYYIVDRLYRSDIRKTRRWLMAASVVLNIGLLLYFKYANFFVENVNAVLESMGMNTHQWTYIALPIGISFFTFQKLTYSVDVYRGVHKPLAKVTDYAMYILMFPQLIAGPIVRFNEIADQIEDRKYNENIDNRLTGFFRFIVGLSKKVLIANVLGEQVDYIFSLTGDEMNTYTAWVGIIAYAFQIYYDFSGYSDMAIGIGRMIGFDFPENFNNPYTSRSISEFWRRWHITLGRFMKDYLYIPLGGNKVKTTRRLYFNLWFVFLLSGLWHGAAWNFVIWGAFHGLFLILDRLFLLKLLNKIGKVPAVIFTFIVTLVGWVLFRAESLDYAWYYIQKMFVLEGGRMVYYVDSKFWTMMVIGGVFAFFAIFNGVEKWQNKVFAKEHKMRTFVLMFVFSVLFFVLSLSSITSSGFNPFIYFRF